MSLGIENILESIDDLESAVLNGIAVAKGEGSIFNRAARLFDLGKDMVDLVKDLKDCLPEACDIDSAEAGELMTRVYELTKNVIEKVVE